MIEVVELNGLAEPNAQIFPAVIALVVSAALTPLVAQWARRRNLLDVPNYRSSHVVATPRTGGWTLTLAALIGLGVLTMSSGAPFAPLVPIIAGAAAIAFVGLIDDLRPLPATGRLLIQVAVALIVVCWVGPTPLHTDVPRLLGVAVTVLWIVAFTNAFNFMDGIDGIAGAQAIIGGLGWFALGTILARADVAGMALVLIAATAGFLIHNWPPARVFMGDAGSGFLGFTYAALPLMLADAGPRALTWGVLLMWPFVFDTGFTLVRRARLGEDVFKAHRSHLYQRLTVTGMTHRAVTAVYAGLATVGVLATLVSVAGGLSTSAAACAAVAGVGGGLWFYVTTREVRAAER